MRRILLACGLLALFSGLLVLWSHRFERVPGAPVLILDDFRPSSAEWPRGVVWIESGGGNQLLVGKSDAHPPISLAVPLESMAEIGLLHVSVGMTARGLRRGGEKWQDGRVMIEWLDPVDGTQIEIDPVGSVRDNDSTGAQKFVLRPSRQPALAVLRVEHLGVSGEFVVENLELSHVRETKLWKSGRWLLLAGYVAWIWALFATCAASSPMQRFLALILMLGLTLQFVVPGPWKSVRPLVVGYRLAAVSEPLGTSTEERAPQTAGLTAGSESLGKLPVRGGITIRIRYYLSFLKPLLHVLLLLVPTLFFTRLLDRRMAIRLGIGLSLAIELSQTAFGYGFGWDDVFDLVCNAAGIAAGLWLARLVPSLYQRRSRCGLIEDRG